MRIPLEPGDRKLLMVAGLLLAFFTAGGLLLSPPGAGPSWGYPSTYSTASDGAKATYLLLGELGYEVERWERPPADLPEQPEHTLLILAEPFIPASAEEKSQIRNFISKGGWVLATGKSGAMLLPESGLPEAQHRAPGAEEFPAQLPSLITREAPQIELERSVRWATRQPHHLAHYGDGESGSVVSYRDGKGQAIWWSGPGPLTNYGLTRASNLMFFLNCVGSRERSRILWDEYFHGQRPGLLAYLGRTPAPWLMLQLFVAFAAVVFTYSRRSGPVQALATSGARLSPLEFVETLGDLYQRKHAAAGALETAYHRFRFLLLRRLGLPSSATSEDICRAARDRLGWQEQDFFKFLTRCARATKGIELSEGETLRLVQELHDYVERWRLGSEQRGE